VTAPDSRPVLDVIADVQRDHTIECTGIGEVTCRGCRGLGWMSWTAYRTHVAAAVLAACQGATVAQQAELVKGRVDSERFYPAYPHPRTGEQQFRVVGPWVPDVFAEDPS
jgi:hypothetical protein